MAEPKNNYKIKPYRSEEENENRSLYRSKDNIRRKWLSICGDVNEHGNKVIYEKCLVQAFNLTEFVMDNYIEQLFNAANSQDNLKKIEKKTDKAKDKWNKGKREENGIYEFIQQNVTIDFEKQFGFGYSGKTEILERLGHTLPEYIVEVRKNRNKYAHGTDTYKNSIRDEVNSYETIKRYMKTLGELLVVMKKLPKECIDPSYEELKLQVGKAVGHEDKYVALTLVSEDEKGRLFYGKNSSTQRPVSIYEMVPTKNILDIYHRNQKELIQVVGNGIVRTEEVLLKNKTCYIVTEKIEGDLFSLYLRAHRNDTNIKKDLMYQVEKILRNIYKYPNITTQFRETDLVVDSLGDLWLTQYEIGKKQFPEKEFLRRYRLILGIEEEKEEPQAEVKATPQPQKMEVKEEPVKAAEVIKEREVVRKVQKETVKENKSILEPVGIVEEPEEKVYKEYSVWTTMPDAKGRSNQEKGEEVFRISASKHPKVQDVMVQVEMGNNPNNWAKLWGTLGACSGILIILWAISGLLA